MNNQDLQITIKSYSSIEEINSNEWNLLLNENIFLNSYGYQAAIEKSKINDFRYHYYMFYLKNELIAHVSTGIISFDLEMFGGPFLKKVVSFVRKIMPSFFKIKMIECGHPTALGTTIEVRDKKYLLEVLKYLDIELIKLAKLEKTSLIAIRDFYSNQRKEADVLLNYHYEIVHNMPNTFLKIDFKSFDDYLLNLSSKRRNEIKKHFDQFNKSNCVIEKIVDFANISTELEKLWKMTFIHSKDYQREILKKEYFQFISDFLKEKSFILLCKNNEKLIGFTMFVDSGETLISTYCGLDYDYNKNSAVYFMLFYKSVEEAIQLNKKYLELGITNYNPKIEIGAITEATYIYSKSINLVLNLFFSKLLDAINNVPKFTKRNIFNKNYYLKFDYIDKIFLQIEKKEIIVKNINSNFIECESDYCFLKNKIYKVEMKIPDDFSILLKVKLKKINKINDNLYFLTFIIVKIEREFVLHFNKLIDYFEFRSEIKK